MECFLSVTDALLTISINPFDAFLSLAFGRLPRQPITCKRPLIIANNKKKPSKLKMTINKMRFQPKSNKISYIHAIIIRVNAQAGKNP